MYDLNEETWACFAHDDDRPVRVKRWEVREVELPEWLDPEEWLEHIVSWHWIWSVEGVKEFPEPWQRALLAVLKEHGTVSMVACAELLTTKNFRSPFRASLRDQLVKWAETPPEERQYESPFSRRQWECLVTGHARRRARRLDEHAYATFRA